MRSKLFIHIIFAFTLAFSQDAPFSVSEEIESVQEFNSDHTNTEEILKDPYVLNDLINQRNFDSDFQAQYQTRDFDYHRNIPRKSLWERIWSGFAEILSKIFKVEDIQTINDFSIWIFRIIAFGIIGLVLYWLIRFLISKEDAWFFKRKNDKLNPNVRTITENIHEIDFNSLISQYENQKNYRFSVRYQYLKLLKSFSDKGFLIWDPDKTNLDYINELKDNSRQNAFARLTHVFDHVWYGDFQIDAETYEKYKTEFTQLIKSNE